MQTPRESRDTDAIVRALVPGIERGRAWLLVGGSAGDRRARIDEVVAGLQASRPAPVVVRVSTDARESGLGDEISAAAESVLSELAAPGPLYDDPAGGAFAGLGGWLFRARSIDRHGIVLVLDDVDRWLDARGGGGRGDEATAVIDSALREATRRPVSVIASVRASDAAGTPSLSADRVAKFDQIEQLGGSSTVARDPTQLVTMLAGRSFTVASLRQALAGWLGVPGDDDTVVTFSSPLAPTSVGPLPDATDVAGWESRSAPDDASVAAPQEQWSEWSGARWIAGIRGAMETGRALAKLGSADRPRSHRQFERAFREAVCQLPVALAELADAEAALGIARTRLHARGERALAAFETSFADFYSNAFIAWRAGSARPTMLCDLPPALNRLAIERKARGTAFVVLSGLRMDAWLRLRDRLLPRLPGLKVLEEGTLWAARPTTPAVQRELLARGLAALTGELSLRDEPPPARSLAEALQPRREHVGLLEVLRIDAYASELQRDAAPLGEVVARIEHGMAETLWRLCGTFAGRTVLAIAGDVGLRETPLRTDGRLSYRREFGGDSPFEAVVPYALLVWG